MKKIWESVELAELWSLSFEEMELLKTKPSRSHLGFCIQLKYYQNTGLFPQQRTDISEPPLYFLCSQLECKPDELIAYNWKGRSGRRHRLEILFFLKIKKANENDKELFLKWLISEIYPTDPDGKYAYNHAYEWFLGNKLECPASKELSRLINSAARTYEEGLFQFIESSLLPKTKLKIDTLLTDNSEVSFSGLKADPGRIGLESILKEVKKLNFIRSLDISSLPLSKIQIKTIKRYHHRLSSESTWEVNRHPKHVKYTMVVLFCYIRQREIIDGLTELLIQIVHRITVRAEKKVVKELFKDFRKIHGKQNLLFKIAEAVLENPEGSVKDVVYPIAGEDTLNNLLKEYKSKGPAYQYHVHTIIRASYSHHYRRMLPKILDTLTFCSNNQMYKPVIDALNWIKKHRDSKKQFYTLDEGIPLTGAIQNKWREVIVEKDSEGVERINRINYEIYVLQTLREQLRCKEIWVEGSDRYQNPDNDLPLDFNEKRDYYYQLLGQDKSAENFIEQLRQGMQTSLKKLNTNIPNSKKVRILQNVKNKICLTPLDAQPEPTNIAYLKREIMAHWSMTELLDILKETDLRINLTECFQSSASSEKIPKDVLQKRLLLSLYGMGTNIGLKRVVDSRQGITYKELLQVRRKYIQKANIRQAISKVVNAIFEVRNPDIWGEGTTSCASDSKKFGSWDQNLMTEWHIRYGGRGVMIYWHVEKKSTCIYSQLKRCSSSEVSSMIEGVLRHCTEMSIDKQYVDSHGQSEVAFAFSYLLGFNLGTCTK